MATEDDNEDEQEAAHQLIQSTVPVVGVVSPKLRQAMLQPERSCRVLTEAQVTKTRGRMLQLDGCGRRHTLGHYSLLPLLKPVSVCFSLSPFLFPGYCWIFSFFAFFNVYSTCYPSNRRRTHPAVPGCSPGDRLLINIWLDCMHCTLWPTPTRWTTALERSTDLLTDMLSLGFARPECLTRLGG